MTPVGPDGEQERWRRASLWTFIGVVVGLPLLLGLGLPDPPPARAKKKPFDASLVAEIRRERPDVIMLGSSMLNTRIDYPLLSKLTGQKVWYRKTSGAASAVWYLSLKNHIVASGVKPHTVVVFFRDAFLTRPAMRTKERNYAKRIEQYSMPEEPLFERLVLGDDRADWQRGLDDALPFRSLHEPFDEWLSGVGTAFGLSVERFQKTKLARDLGMSDEQLANSWQRRTDELDQAQERKRKSKSRKGKEKKSRSKKTASGKGKAKKAASKESANDGKAKEARSRKGRAKATSAKKSRAKKARAKKSRAKKAQAKKAQAKKAQVKKAQARKEDRSKEALRVVRVDRRNEEERRRVILQVNSLFEFENMSRLSEDDVRDSSESDFDFHRLVERSFLPAMIELARDEGIHLHFVRVRRRPRGGVGRVDSDELRQYIADLYAYLDQHGASHTDLTQEARITEDRYGNGDHIHPDHRAWYTRLFHELVSLEPPRRRE